MLALWSELAPDLDEMDSYGGVDYATEDHVAELLGLNNASRLLYRVAVGPVKKIVEPFDLVRQTGPVL
jgi:hypothetical protein